MRSCTFDFILPSLFNVLIGHAPAIIPVMTGIQLPDIIIRAHANFVVAKERHTTQPLHGGLGEGEAAQHVHMAGAVQDYSGYTELPLP